MNTRQKPQDKRIGPLLQKARHTSLTDGELAVIAANLSDTAGRAVDLSEVRSMVAGLQINAGRESASAFVCNVTPQPDQEAMTLGVQVKFAINSSLSVEELAQLGADQLRALLGVQSRHQSVVGNARDEFAGYDMNRPEASSPAAPPPNLRLNQKTLHARDEFAGYDLNIL